MDNDEPITIDVTKRYYTDAKFRSYVEHSVRTALIARPFPGSVGFERASQIKEAMTLAAGIALLLKERGLNGINETSIRSH